MEGAADAKARSEREQLARRGVPQLKDVVVHLVAPRRGRNELEVWRLHCNNDGGGRRRSRRSSRSSRCSFVRRRRQQLNAHAKTSLARDKSNLLTAQGLCTQDISTRGKLLYAAAVMDPTNQFAINEGMQLLESVKRAQQQQQQKGGSN